MPHQVFVGVPQQVVAFGAVLREVEGRVLEDGDQVREALDHLLPRAELRRIVEVRHVGQLVGPRQRPEDVLVDLVADVGLALEGHHVGKARALRDGDRGVGLACVTVADVLHEQQHEDVVLVLRGVHAPAQLVAGGPEGGVQLRLLQCHGRLPVGGRRIAARKEGRLFGNPDPIPGAMRSDEHLNHVGDGAVLAIGGHAQRLLEGGRNAERQRAGLARGHESSQCSECAADASVFQRGLYTKLPKWS